jgi:hypothetical protein
VCDVAGSFGSWFACIVPWAGLRYQVYAMRGTHLLLDVSWNHATAVALGQRAVCGFTFVH